FHGFVHHLGSRKDEVLLGYQCVHLGTTADPCGHRCASFQTSRACCASLQTRRSGGFLAPWVATQSGSFFTTYIRCPVRTLISCTGGSPGHCSIRISSGLRRKPIVV